MEKENRQAEKTTTTRLSQKYNANSKNTQFFRPLPYYSMTKPVIYFIPIIPEAHSQKREK